MITFDSKFDPPGICEQIHDSVPSFIEHDIDIQYSKEVEYLKEVDGYKKGWDSYEGKIADKDSIRSSIDVLSSFATELKALKILSSFPEFCLASDGILGLEWDYAKNANLFARIYSRNKIEYRLTENNNKQPLKETNSANFIGMCKEKLQHNQAV